MRMLKNYELDLVSGGCTSSDCTGEDITVIAKRDTWILDDLAWYTNQGTYSQGDGFVGSGGDTTTQPADSDAIDIIVKIPGELTAAQLADIEALKAAIVAATEKINSIPDNATVTLPNGSTVTGAELKGLWAMTDFVINPEGYDKYRNESGRGEADYNGGNPQISFNIDLVSGYAQHGAAGMDYLVLHELGHVTQANLAFDDTASNPQSEVERMANDIGRAIAAFGDDLPFLMAPELLFSPGDPLIFETPTSGGDGDGGGFGGGGSGGNGDWIP